MRMETEAFDIVHLSNFHAVAAQVRQAWAARVDAREAASVAPPMSAGAPRATAPLAGPPFPVASHEGGSGLPSAPLPPAQAAVSVPRSVGPSTAPIAFLAVGMVDCRPSPAHVRRGAYGWDAVVDRLNMEAGFTGAKPSGRTAAVPLDALGAAMASGPASES